jgi:hypothetical protein
LVVGALNQDKTSASFSSWGLTDDGRVKPDLVAKGVSLYSSYSSGDNVYAYMSGTSMATPVVTGICGLVTEQMWKTGLLASGANPAPSALRAVLIHTAEDLGSVGPDGGSGWGLADARAAADFVQAAANSGSSPMLISNVLSPGTKTSYQVNHPGGRPFRATLTWADPAGNSNTGGDNDRTPAVIHDLNLTAQGPDGVMHYPWKLDALNPSAPATRGVNSVDTVERVDIDSASAPAGTYTVTVSHGGALLNSQRFALATSGGSTSTAPALPPPTAPTGLSPNGVCVKKNLVYLKWKAPAGASAYDVVVQYPGTYGVAAGTTVNTQVSLRLPVRGTYYWWVRARNASGVSAWSSAWFVR